MFVFAILTWADTVVAETPDVQRVVVDGVHSPADPVSEALESSDQPPVVVIARVTSFAWNTYRSNFETFFLIKFPKRVNRHEDREKWRHFFIARYPAGGLDRSDGETAKSHFDRRNSFRSISVYKPTSAFFFFLSIILGEINVARWKYFVSQLTGFSKIDNTQFSIYVKKYIILIYYKRLFVLRTLDFWPPTTIPPEWLTEFFCSLQEFSGTILALRDCGELRGSLHLKFDDSKMYEFFFFFYKKWINKVFSDSDKKKKSCSQDVLERQWTINLLSVSYVANSFYPQQCGLHTRVQCLSTSGPGRELISPSD